MSKKYYILVVAAVVIVGGFMFYENSRAPESAPGISATPTAPLVQTATITTGPVVKGVVKGTEHNVIFSNDAFNPQELTIKKRDTVTWVNNGDRNIWPASANHPTHTKYPGSSIVKCGTSEENKIFDACRNISPGSSYSFQFNEVGSWGYHDHLRSSVMGKIIVME